MQLTIILSALILSFFNSSIAYAQKSNVYDKMKSLISDSSLNGFYSGIEYVNKMNDPDYPRKKIKLFYLGYLKIKGDSLFLDQIPIFVRGKDTTYSSSDGGFFYWRGSIKQNDTSIIFNLTEYYCEYCGTLVRKNKAGKDEFYPRKKQISAKLTTKGILIKGYLYRRVAQADTLISEQPKPKWAPQF